MREQWEELETIDKFERGRSVVEEALSANLQKIFDKNVPYGSILEIGGGAGALRDRLSPSHLRRLFPSARKKLYHLDGSHNYSAELARKYPKANVVIGDAYELPIHIIHCPMYYSS